MNEAMPISVNVALIATDPKTGREVGRAEAHNLVTSAGKTWVAKFLSGEEDTGLSHCEVGTGNTSPTVSDTALDTSEARNAITTTSRAANVVTLRTFFAAADVTANIQEVGLFGGTGATGTAGTGTMLARALISFDNTAGTKDITVVWSVTVG